MANDFSFTQMATVLADIASQVMGTSVLAPVDTSQFVNVATTVLQQGYDPILKAVSQMVGNTIFSIRPYTRKFRTLERSVQAYGNHVRKLQALDTNWENDEQWELVDGQSVDMYKVNKPKVLQTNFYGFATRQRHYSIFRDQLNNAFKGPAELAQFWSMIIQNQSDSIEQSHENISRYTVANFIAGILTINNEKQIVHLVTEYNTRRALETPLTWADIVKDNDTYIDFMQFAFSRMEKTSEFLRERTYLFHQNLSPSGTLLNIPRHTPYERQRAMFLTENLNDIATHVYTNVYHEQYLRMLSHERVNFWQNISSPDAIMIKPSYTKNDGTIGIAEESVAANGIFGLIYDEEAMGTTVVDTWSSVTPINSAGGYWNHYDHFTDKWWNDWTENAILFMLN